MDKNKRSYGWVLTVVLWVLAAITLLAAFKTRDYLEQKSQAEVEPPQTILTFLDEFIPAKSYVHQEEIIEEYITGVDTSTIDHDGRSQTLRDFNAVFLHERGEAATYRVCNVKANYLEIMLMDDDGNDLPCRIGLFYRVTGEGRISSYNLVRLQPVSKADSEWNGEWQ